MAKLYLDFTRLNGKQKLSFPMSQEVPQDFLKDYKLWDESIPFVCSKDYEHNQHSCSECLFGSWGFNYDANCDVKNLYYKLMIENAKNDYISVAQQIMEVEKIQTDNENANYMSWRLEENE